MSLPYKMKGKGMAVLLLHAFPLSSRMWAGEMEALSDSFTVIAPDFPGFGKSPRQKTPSIADMATAAGELLDQLKIKEAFVGGLSMGGYVTFEFLRQFPERVKGLGIFSTRAAADKSEVREKRFKTIESIQKEGFAPFAKMIQEKLLGETTRKTNPSVVKEIKEMVESADSEGVKDATLAMANRSDLDYLLPKIHCPALIIAGDEDPFVPAEEAKTIHSKIQGSALHILPKTGHMVNLEQPAAFQKILKDFLKKI